MISLYNSVPADQKIERVGRFRSQNNLILKDSNGKYVVTDEQIWNHLVLYPDQMEEVMRDPHRGDYAGSPANKRLSPTGQAYDGKLVRAMVMFIAVSLISLAAIFGAADKTMAMGTFLAGGVFLLWVVIVSL